jgi:hypothetical protein
MNDGRLETRDEGSEMKNEGSEMNDERWGMKVEELVTTDEG